MKIVDLMCDEANEEVAKILASGFSAYANEVALQSTKGVWTK